MKRTLFVVCVLVLSVSLLSGQISGQNKTLATTTTFMSGTYTVGSGGSYATLGAAFADINARGVFGAVTLSIISDITENNYPDSLEETTVSASDPVTIVPASGLNPRITLPLSPLFISGTSYVTFDGSNNGSTSRNLTIKHMTGGSGTSLIKVIGSSSHVTIKNCILGNDSSVADYAIRFAPTVSYPTDLLIQNNEIHGVGNSNGIVYLEHAGNRAMVTKNIISGDSAGSSKAYGINIGTTQGADSVAITKNQIYVLKCAGTGETAGIREDANSQAYLLVANNMVGGQFSAPNITNNLEMLGMYGSGAKKIYFNTLYLNSTGSPFFATCLYLDGGTADFQNNIAYNAFNDASAHCIVEDLNFTPGNLTSNYNDLYVSGVNAYTGYITLDYKTLPQWQSGSSKDAQSQAVSVAFGTSPDLHVAGASDGDGNLKGNAAINSTVSDDIDGDSRRSGNDGPYMGADEGSTALPVQLVSVTATAERLDAVLRWSTATETNNYGFDIERRQVSNLQWAKVGFVPGAGTSTSAHEYAFRDANLTPGRYAYRVKQIDNEGSFAYYAAAEVEVGLAPKVLSLRPNYPNPFNPATNIEFTVPDDGKVRLRVFNIIGQEVAALFDAEAEAGRIYQATFDASSLPSGVYVSRLEFGGKSLLRKMIFMK